MRTPRAEYAIRTLFFPDQPIRQRSPRPSLVGGRGALTTADQGAVVAMACSRDGVSLARNPRLVSTRQGGASSATARMCHNADGMPAKRVMVLTRVSSASGLQPSIAPSFERRLPTAYVATSVHLRNGDMYTRSYHYSTEDVRVPRQGPREDGEDG
jgi:hypothetical protein